MTDTFNFLKPVEDGVVRPRWSVMIPTYNCAGYLRETLESVLQQDEGPQEMQIVVVDDGSTDDPGSVVKDVGKGRVQFFRQLRNVGHIRNFETALDMSRGNYVHLLHGDDRVLWGFYKEMGKVLDANSQAGAAFCRYYYMGADGHQKNISTLLSKESGILSSFFEQSLKSNLIQTPSIVVRRQVYETIGMFDHRLLYTEDWEMWTRIGKHLAMAYVTKPLAEYRIHESSHTARTVQSGKALTDLLMAMEVITSHCPEKKVELQKVWKESIGYSMLNFAKQLLRENKCDAALQQYRISKALPQSYGLHLRWYKFRIWQMLGKSY